MKKYQVIGGQYERHYYGESDTLRGARRIASKHMEYWDNFAGWHKPAIYRAEDCKVVTCSGMITYPDGAEVVLPVWYAEPVQDWERD